MRARLSALWLALGACSADAPADAPVDTEEALPPIDAPTDDGPYVEDEVPVEPIEFDADAVGAVVEDALPVARATSAVVLQAAYAEVLAEQSEGCPAWTTSEDGVPYWFDACTSDVGARFEGYAYSVDAVDLVDGDITWNGWQFFGLATIRSSAGSVFEATGQAGALRGVQADGADVFYTYMSEGFRYDGPAAAGTWLESAASPELVAYVVQYPETGGRVMALSGRILLDDGPARALVFEELQVANAAVGDPCPEEPAGMVSVLDAQGAWVDLMFDGVPFDQWASGRPPTCDGCARAWHGGADVGEVCIDISSLTEWTDSPWQAEGDTN